MTLEEKRIGAYRIIKKLASGGMAEIFLCDSRERQKVIVKRILRDYSDSDDFITMFLNEAKLSVNLRHANIVNVSDFGNWHGNYFLAMEYIFGRDLGCILKTVAENRLFIPIDVAVYIAEQICLGLDYAHFKRDAFNKLLNIVHRDISPPNLMIGFDGSVKILDFGIAKATALSSALQTRSGVLKGKFSYMSPEQAYGKEVDRRTDIFSTAIVLYEMLTSRSLFYSHDDIEILEKVRKARVAPPSSLNPSIPSELDKIILKALARKVKHRYQTAHDFAEALHSFRQSTYPATHKTTVAAYLQSLFSEEFRDGLERDLASPKIIADQSDPSFDEQEMLIDDIPHTEVSEVDELNDSIPDLPKISRHLIPTFIRENRAHLFAIILMIAISIMAVYFFAERFDLIKNKAQNTFIESQRWIARLITPSPPAAVSPSLLQPRISEEIKSMPSESVVQTAEKLFRSRSYLKAIPYLAQALSAYPINLELRAKLAVSYIYAREVRRGCTLISGKPAVDIPRPALYYLIEGLCYEYDHEKRAALDSYKSYLETDPNGIFHNDVVKIIKNLN